MKREVPQYRAYPIFRFAVAAGGAVGVLALVHAYMWSELGGSSAVSSVYNWHNPDSHKTMALLINIFLPAMVGGGILGWRKFEVRRSVYWGFICGVTVAANLGQWAIIQLLGTVSPEFPSVSGMSRFVYWFWNVFLSFVFTAVVLFGGKQKWNEVYK